MIRLALVLALSFTSIVAQAQSDVVEFRVLAEHEDGRTSISNIVEVSRPLHIYLPTAFTPDGDGLNDMFEVKGEGISEFKMVIYDRWGNQLFVSNSHLQGWDGKVAGTESPTGAYTYELTATGHEFGSISKMGVINLLRP